MAKRALSRSDWIVVAGSAVAVALAGIARYTGVNSVLAFVVAAVAVALLASLVGRSVEHLGDRFGEGATGVLQSALGNLPELFIGFFALQAGLTTVVQSAIIGSMLANILLVLGLSFTVGGLRHGVQHFNDDRARITATLLVLATAALVLPSVATYVHSPAEPHEQILSVVASVVLLAVFALSLPASLRDADPPASGPTQAADTERSQTDAVGARKTAAPAETREASHWPLWLAITMLTVSSVAAALVSDWFVHGLEPAMETLHISQAFAGLVIVAIAGNAIENVVGIQLAARNQPDFALSIILNSPLQIALVLAPALVLLSFFTATTLTLVFAPMLVVSVVLTVLVAALIVYDGESTWLEGVILMALYALIAATFWWG